MRYGTLSIDQANHEVRCGNKLIELTASEYKILLFFASHPGFAYSRASIIDGAMGRNITVLERTIDVHIMSLRKKLGRCGALIQTLRGFGYKMQDSNLHE
jgi:two-component system phosphate regulon response regulator PhoB